MTIMDAISLLDNLVDESDPDVSNNNNFQKIVGGQNASGMPCIFLVIIIIILKLLP